MALDTRDKNYHAYRHEFCNLSVIHNVHVDWFTLNFAVNPNIVSKP